jgi:hypothetical protein
VLARARLCHLTSQVPRPSGSLLLPVVLGFPLFTGSPRPRVTMQLAATAQ